MIIKEYIKSVEKVGKYGITFLDDFLGGIRKSDFVLIGADTGVGKSTLAYQIAYNNCINKNVHLFALEAEKYEPYAKRAYTYIANQYFNKRTLYKNITMSYRSFIEGKIDVASFEPGLTKYMDSFYKLRIHYKGKEFTIDTLLSAINKIIDSCDMIILDHIDYFDLISDKENSEVTGILKALRAVSMDTGTPIIMFSHIRKSQFKQTILPHKDDFMGTSNKTKITKTSILISPDFNTCDYVTGEYGTYIQIPKDRAYGKTNLVARCVFDRHKNKYADAYELHRINGGAPDDKVLTVNELPRWANNAKEVL